MTELALMDKPAPVPAPAPAESLAERRLQLPGGVVGADGRCHQMVRVRELTGADEEVLAEKTGAGGARLVTRFLARVIVEIEGLARRIDEDLVSDMLVGDRDYLLLRLRQIDLGDHVHQVMRCPSSACGKKVDVDFLVSEIEVTRATEVLPSYRVQLGEGAAARSAVVRLPTGRDQEAVAPLAATNPAAANTRLFSRVVLRWSEGGSLDEDAARALPLRHRSDLAAFLERTSPGPDLHLDLHCPWCGGDMGHRFDLDGFFLPSAR
jgi:hypothetical protein